MHPFVNCMYCKFPRINDSWFLIPEKRREEKRREDKLHFVSHHLQTNNISLGLLAIRRQMKCK